VPARDYQRIISELLDLLIRVELIRAIVDYLSSLQLRITFIGDAIIVFILRGILIDLFEAQVDPDLICAMSVLRLALSVLRFGAIVLYRDGFKRHDVIAKS